VVVGCCICASSAHVVVRPSPRGAVGGTVRV